MRPSQPMADTYVLLAGGQVKRAPRLGEERPAVECAPETIRRSAGSGVSGQVLRLGSWLWALIVSL